MLLGKLHLWSPSRPQCLYTLTPLTILLSDLLRWGAFKNLGEEFQMCQHHFSSCGLNGSIVLGFSSHWHFSFSLDQIQNVTSRSLGVNLWKDLVYLLKLCKTIIFPVVSNMVFPSHSAHAHMMQLANMSQIYSFPLQKKLFTCSWWVHQLLFVFESARPFLGSSRTCSTD